MDTEISRIKKRKLRAKREENFLQMAKATKDLADLYYNAGRLDEALEEYSEEAEAWHVVGDKLNCAMAHRMIGETFTKLGEFQSALKHLNLHLEGAQEMESKLEEQRAYAMLGWTHFCLGESYSEQCEKRTEALASSKRAYTKAIQLCNKLNGISKEELMTMRARLLLNVGLVEEAQELLDEAIDFIRNAIEICLKYKLREDLQKAHLALTSIYEKQDNIELALEQLDTAIKDATPMAKATVLLAKAEFLLKIGDWINARKMLVSLYQVKALSEVTCNHVERLLRIAVTLDRGEKELNNRHHDENIRLNISKLYEKMGDAATAVFCYKKALEYYKKMLFYAEQNESSERIAVALVSLSRTFKDAKLYQEALVYAKRELDMCSEPSEACRSALFLAEVSESAGLDSLEIHSVYKLALLKAEMSGDKSLEVAVMKNYLPYLESENSVEAKEINARLDHLLETISEVESEVENLENTDIGADILLDELSDLEQDKKKEEIGERIGKQRSLRQSSRRGLAVKKNEKGETMLHVACINGNVERVEKLIGEGHPINVTDNLGWTPLHEAANHGFVEITGLLINAGANISDPGGPGIGGITPLHDAATCGEFAVMNLLIDKGADIYAVTNEGKTTLDCLEDWRTTQGDLNAVIESEYEFVHSKLSAKGVPRKKDKKRVNESDERRKRNRRNVIDESEDEYINEDTDVANISAGEDYKRTIAVLRNRGTQSVVSAKFSPKKKDLPPLLDSEQILLEEWLEDDMGIGTSTSMKKKNLSDSLPKAKRKSSEFVISEERERKRQKVQVGDAAVSLNICDDDYDNEGSCELINVIEDSEAPARELTKPRKWKKQSSLLSSGFLRQSGSRTPSPIPKVLPQMTSEQKLEAGDRYLNLQVIIDNKIIVLRLHMSDERKITAENVVKEVEKKFEEDTGCIPRFDLVGPHDIILASQDLIGDFATIENPLTLTTKLKNMDIPVISDRYKKICGSSHIDIEEDTLKCLKICENTSTFRLRGRRTHKFHKEILPLLKTLEYEIRLQTLRLSSMDINEIGDVLNRCLSRLSSLQELQLRCCDIDSVCLSKIENFPLEIRVLDLSYNPLGKESSARLQELLSPLKSLQTLNLSNCGLEEILLGTGTSSVIKLDVSQNLLGGEGLRCILQAHMLSLNASGCTTEGKTPVSTELLSHPIFSFEMLESLELSCCNLCDSDLSEILLKTVNLTKLVVNGNPKLSKQSVLQILRHTPTFSYIDVSGCSEITEPPENKAYDCCAEISTLVISMAPEVQQAWLCLWNGEGSVQTLPYHVAIFKRN